VTTKSRKIERGSLAAALVAQVAAKLAAQLPVDISVGEIFLRFQDSGVIHVANILRSEVFV
jgi:hypothetical protein